MIIIREESSSDAQAIRQINDLAFEHGPEAALVDNLRASCDGYLSFVAVDHNSVIGHILFTPVTLDGSRVVGMGLAPMAVLPSHQGEGVGSLLIRHGLDHLQKSGCPFVIVLGHPDYYPRFGFEPASHYKLISQWETVPDEAFMVVVFDRQALPGEGGIVRYRDAFNEAI
ncbi:MAG: N-acetyltransferase [Gammaproteobacteria bacterium]|nr:N-acetyltransferase [Gammaproteobacteria bacterium]